MKQGGRLAYPKAQRHHKKDIFPNQKPTGNCKNKVSIKLLYWYASPNVATIKSQIIRVLLIKLFKQTYDQQVTSTRNIKI
jgi:hypothetical protein